ncbi:MAG: hypothetical protein WCI18_01420 [Pseudomonadota bacterium]
MLQSPPAQLGSKSIMLNNFYKSLKTYQLRLFQAFFLFLCLFLKINPNVNKLDNLSITKSSTLALSSEINESRPFDFLYSSHKPIKSGLLVGIKLGTYGRKLACKVRIVSSTGAMTDWGKCPDDDWGLLTLKTLRDFSTNLSSYTLETDAKQGAGFALSRVIVDGGTTLELLELRQRSAFSEIWNWVGDYSFWALPWLVLFFFFLKNSYFGTSRLSAVYIVALMCTGAWPYSGHDETAHITGLHWSGLVAAGKNMAEVDAAQKDFFPKVHRSLKEFKFEELHGVKLATPESCPHAFLGSCSYSPESKTFRTYLVFWKLVGSPDVAAWNPVAFLAIGRAFNLILFLLFSYLVVQFFPKNYSQSALASLVICGSFLGQVGSINPEQFGYYSAVFCALFLVSRFEQSKALKLQFFLGFSIFGLLSLLSDNSGLLFIPTFILAGILYFLSTLESFKSLKVQYLGSRALWCLACLGLFSGLWLGFRFFHSILAAGFSEEIVRFTPLKPFQRFIEHAYSLSFKDTCRGLLEFFKSFLGSYTWGHDYYPRVLYSIGYAAIFAGLIKAVCTRKSFKFDLLSLTVGLYFLTILISMIAGGTFQEVDIIKESFLKPRIYGPAIFPIFQLLILAGITMSDKYFGFLKYLGLYLVTSWLFSLR